MANLLNISGDEKVRKVYAHFDLLCNSLDDQITRHKLDEKEVAQLLEGFLRPLISYLSSICLKLNRVHLLRDQSKNKLKGFRTKRSKELRRKKITMPKKGRMSMFIRTTKDSLDHLISTEEHSLNNLKAEYDRLLHALDECICLMHHDFITCPTIQDTFVLGKKLSSEEATRSRILEELDQLLSTAADEKDYLDHYEESIANQAQKD